jgi:hypothetical protein
LGAREVTSFIYFNFNTWITGAGKAKVRDPILQNAWGVAFSPAPSPFWISDNATGCSTLYDGDGTIVALQVKIPLPGGKVPATACHHANSATGADRPHLERNDEIPGPGNEATGCIHL